MFLLEFPQNIMGYFAYLYFSRKLNRPVYRYQEAYVTHVPGSWGGISLSRFIFLDDNHFGTKMVKHEYGHTIQSRRLLFLYLFVIGVPSLVWNRAFRGYRARNRVSYYHFYTESWANRLGGYNDGDSRRRL